MNSPIKEYFNSLDPTISLANVLNRKLCEAVRCFFPEQRFLSCKRWRLWQIVSVPFQCRTRYSGHFSSPENILLITITVDQHAPTGTKKKQSIELIIWCHSIVKKGRGRNWVKNGALAECARMAIAQFVGNGKPETYIGFAHTHTEHSNICRKLTPNETPTEPTDWHETGDADDKK